MEKDKELLEKELKEQIELIKNSVDAYDRGSIVEYKNLATRVRVLVHDTEKSQSLLNSLGVKEEIRFFDSCFPYISNVVKISWYGLVQRHSAFKDFVPILNSYPSALTKVKFAQWWEKPVLIDAEENSLSRKRIILAVANKDGGAHVAVDLEDKSYKGYFDMTLRKTLGGMFSKDGTTWEESLAIPGTIRQIAEEILMTLDNDYVGSQNNPYEEKEGIIMAGMQIGVEPMPVKNKIGRNDLCPCGSGYKYKYCCLPKGGIL
jgi:hypothetical protein